MVRRTKSGIHPLTSAIERIHLWKGAAPSLILNPNRRTSTLNFSPKVKSASPPIRIKIEASVWVRKYLIEASLVNLDFFDKRRGINANVLSSNPTQEMNREGEEIIRHILVKILIIIKSKEGESQIRKEVLPINGAWTH